jgi:isoleucyl-tRNA synthetase
VGTRGEAPYKAVLTHGFVVDGEGKAMHKSAGNVISPEDLIKNYGAEIIRLWVAGEDYRDNIRLSDEILQRLTEAYRRIRNTCRYLLGNLYDFDPANDGVPYERMEELDRWALNRLQETSGHMTTSIFTWFTTISITSVSLISPHFTWISSRTGFMSHPENQWPGGQPKLP